MSRPWMPLYIADYRNKTAHLTAAEHGAYLLLIMHYWVSKGLPYDDDQIMRIAAMTPSEWKKSKPVLQAFFHTGWKHERVDEELAKAEQISSKRRSAAEQRHSKTHANAPANGHANDEQKNIKSTHTRDVVVDCISLEETQEEQASRRKQKTPLSENFVPDRRFALDLGWPEEKINLQIQAFRDSALAHNRKYADWQAAWRNWVNSPYQRGDRPPANSDDARARGDAW